MECFFPFVRLCLSAWRMMFLEDGVYSVYVCWWLMSDKASSVFVVICVQFSFL